jgi:hypothetical protein
MVLQRYADVKIWGWADVNEKVTVSFDGKTYEAAAGADKKFVWARAKIEYNKVVVWNDHVANPVAVRYA